jgi:hypothetical protein
MTTPNEAVEEAIANRLAFPERVPVPALAKVAVAALRSRKQAQPLDPFHSPPTYSPDEWEAFANGYNNAIGDILGSPESTERTAAESDLRDDEFFVRHGKSFHVDLGPGECAVWREIDSGFGVSVEKRNDKVIERRIYRNGTQSGMVRGY